MKKIMLPSLGVLFLVLCVGAAWAGPRTPYPPVPERQASYYEGFNIATSLSTNNLLDIPGVGTFAASFSGYALDRSSATGASLPPWIVPAVSGSGALNVNCASSGALRFWYEPYSSSATAAPARLADLVATGPGGTAVVWSLQVSSNAVLQLLGSTDAGPVTLLSAPITWQAGTYHLVALNFGPLSTELFVDVQLVAQGAGTVAIPPSVGALVLGSAFDGTEPADGALDEVFCFAGPLTPREVAFYYNATAGEAALGPTSAAEDAALAALHTQNGHRMTPMGLGRVYDPDHDMTCSPGGQVYFTNVSATLQTNGSTTISFDVEGGTNGIFYDCYAISDLGEVLDNTQWLWTQQVLTCNHYSLTNQLAGQTFYMLVVPPVTTVYAWGTNTAGQCNVPLGLTSATAVAAGGEFTMALLTNGTVKAWGTNTYGETNLPTGLTNVVSIAAGEYHGVALLPNGAVTNWGSFYDGANYYSVTNTAVATLPPTSNVMAVAAGWEHDLALLSNGTVVAWGLLTADARTVPTNLAGVKAIACGWVHDVALLSNGVVTAWGDNYTGFESNMTTVPTDLTNAAAVAAAGFDSLALRANGTVEAWGDTHYGLTLVPSGLSNVVALAVGGNQMLALQANGTVVAWGATNFTSATVPTNLIAVKAMAAGFAHNAVIYSDSLVPLTAQPPVEYALPGGTVVFTASGLPFANVQYQWQFDGTNITGATNATLTLTNAQVADDGSYRLVLSNGTSTVTGAAAVFTLVQPPHIIGTLPTAPSVNWLGANGSYFVVGATAADLTQYPLNFQWQFNGTNTSVGVFNEAAASFFYPSITNEGTYTVVITNAAGSTNISWTVRLALPGMTEAWGSDTSGESDRPVSLTNAAAIAAGDYHSVAVTDTGTLAQWGKYSEDGTNFYAVGSPPTNANLVAVAASRGHDIALTSAGAVIAWGLTNDPANFVPVSLPSVKAISTGWNHNLALLTNGAVRAWGDNTYGQTNVPTDLTNANAATAVAAGGWHSLALRANGTVETWGDTNYGLSSVPAALTNGTTNVVAIAAGGEHSLALTSNGFVVAWGLNTSGQTNVPAGLSNVMAIAAGRAHSVALKNDGTLVAWGATNSGQVTIPFEGPTNGVVGDPGPILTNYAPIIIKLIAAGGDHSVAAIFSQTVQYPVDVSKDLLLIYNTNSLDSSNVCQYYLTHRPMVSNALVLGIGCTTNDPIYVTDYTNIIQAQVQTWLTNNPTKRPQYVILFQNIPQEVDLYTNFEDTGDDCAPSVQYHLHYATAPAWSPFVTAINMNGRSATNFNSSDGTNDCIAYINKLVSMASNNPPGSLFISASMGVYSNYNNTNWYFDYAGWTNGYYLYADGAEQGVTNVDPTANVIGTTGTNLYGVANYTSHATNVAGYFTAGWDGGLGDGNMFVDGTVQFFGKSGWYIMTTIDSYDGQRVTGQAGYLTWFATNAFWGTNYSNTPVGAVTTVNEPGLPGKVSSFVYYGDWCAGKSFATSAWAAQERGNGGVGLYFQAVGDPFVRK